MSLLLSELALDCDERLWHVLYEPLAMGHFRW